VKIIGEAYPNQAKDLYGSRMIISDYSAIVNDYPAYYKGFARVENCEFNRFGQFSRDAGDDIGDGVLISDLGVYNSSRPTYIRNNAFHNGFGVAIGIFSSQGFPIVNNVIHRTIDYAIRVEGAENIIRGNLVALNQWGSQFYTNEAPLDKTYWGAIDIGHADSAIVEDNYVAGSQRSGFHIRGDLCDGDKLPGNLAHSIKNNTVYGSGNAVAIMARFHYSSVKCLRVSGFTVYKSQYHGIYYQGSPEPIFENNTLIDNQIGIYSVVWGSAPATHVNDNKKIIMRNILIVGRSMLADCNKDIYPKNVSDQYQKYGRYGSGPNGNGRIGFTFGTFTTKDTGMEKLGFAWTIIMSYPQIGGELVVTNVTFANFNTSCGNQYSAITTSRDNDDGQHPITLSNIKLVNVASSSKVWFSRPNLDTINPSDCVDMDCDGLKKNLITDVDGSFLGSPGAIISQSEFEWGSQQRGLGDFRIPKEMLSYPNGSMIRPSSVYSHPGIVRGINNESLCTYQASWQAYECHGLEYRMLIIESMDHDTEDRRLSPVAVLSESGYLDLINGPQDHGWCFGYTCQKRISTFMALIAGNMSYDIVLTSTPPDMLRMTILNADSSFKVRLSMHYSVQQRIDLYKNGNFLDPTNAKYFNGKMQLNNPVPIEKYMPTYSNVSGK
jgi:parallel beta-helix repeat protein